jgi:signal peptidase
MKKVLTLVEPVLIVLFIVMILFSTTIYLLPKFGWNAGDIGSGSMYPELKVGTMIMAKTVSASELKVNDIIVFKPSDTTETPICHRIVEVKNTIPRSYQTKGDNYPTADTFIVPSANVIGRVDISVPVVGYLVLFVKSTIGLILCLIVPAVLLLVILFRYIWKELLKIMKDKIAKESG